QFEHRAVQSLIENAHAVALEPKNLQSRRPSICEDDESSTLLRILSHPLARRLRHPIEAVAHVDRFGAKEDPYACRNHDDCSSTRSRRLSESASNVAGIVRRRLPPSSSSNVLGDAGPVSSTNGSRFGRSALSGVDAVSGACAFSSGATLLPSCHFQNTSVRG